jgi:geranylgeranyl pyrophosphate synthase
MLDFSPITDTIKERVKSTILKEAAKEDSRLWKLSPSGGRDTALNGDTHHSNQTVNGAHHAHSTMLNGFSHTLNGVHKSDDESARRQDSTAFHEEGSPSIDEPFIGRLLDPLDDLLCHGESPQYIPHSLPPGSRSAFVKAEVTASSACADSEAPALPPVSHDPEADPVSLTMNELSRLSQSIREDLIGTDHPVLNKAASYFFDASDGGKKVRPMMVLLLSRALSESVTAVAANSFLKIKPPVAEPLSPTAPLPASLLSRPAAHQRKDLPDAQRRLAEISEMIHTASLFHDDVIDGSDTRRGKPAVHLVFGNKMAILAGDYLLARASISLARLRNVQVVETMSTIIEHLVRGEVMQMRGTDVTDAAKQRLTYYLRKNFYKTGSLMANSCQSAALLGNYSEELVDASYRYGKHIGMAFQLVDDILDFEGSLSHMGKPSLADLAAGLATAPVLFAAEEFPDILEPLVERKFRHAGDIETTVQYVQKSSGLERTKNLAYVHAEAAINAVLSAFPPSLYRDALVQLAYKVIARTK